MKRIVSIIAGLAVLLPAAARAQDEHPTSIGLFPPAQIVPEGESIRGVRLSLIYGKNVDVSGLDLGLVNHTTRDFMGAQFGAVGIGRGFIVVVDPGGNGREDRGVEVVSPG